MPEPARHANASTPDESPAPSSLLVVDDSRLIVGLLAARLARIPGLSVESATTLAQARALLAERPQRFFLALVDLVLPDATAGEAVDLVTGSGVAAVVLSATFSPQVREEQLRKPRVVDYLLKDSPASLDVAANLVQRLMRNHAVGVLVVDDSRTVREHTAGLLGSHRYRVVQARDGVEALEVLESDPAIGLLVTDFHMPRMDGFELVRRVRERRSRDELAAIGMSSSADRALAARFIKSGGNDFLVKPFLEEEFFCRVTQNVEMLEHIAALRDASVRDFLTGLHNRRHLFDAGETLFASAQRGHIGLTAAMIDIDLFKRVNDTYGHDAGDEVIREVARALRARFRRTDLVARMGGEEFCVLAVNLAPGAATRVFDEVRAAVAAAPLGFGSDRIPVSVSIGVCTRPATTLAQSLAVADALLYRAKSEGRNRVVVQD